MYEDFFIHLLCTANQFDLEDSFHFQKYLYHIVNTSLFSMHYFIKTMDNTDTNRRKYSEMTAKRVYFHAVSGTLL